MKVSASSRPNLLRFFEAPNRFNDLKGDILGNRYLLTAQLAAGLLSVSTISANGAYEPSNLIPPKPMREMRGAWIATIGNLDWPLKKGSSTAEQKAELIGLLDRAAQLKLNTIIFQVRPACDALYASSLEPWSEYLTGTMGKAPLPFYDPLAFAVQEAHKRGLELHAWFNPYRARNTAVRWPIAANHVINAHPSWVRRYGSQWWLDPGEKSVQEHLLKVVLDVVRRYDVDGIHFDDYFYPYPEKDRSGKAIDFPDYSSWKHFGVGGNLSHEDWRRENVNALIHQIYESIKSTKPWVKFGVSPFGIWRSGEPAQVKGFDAYASLYADSRKWLANGWVDYLAPQLYWPIDSREQSFPVLLKWWTDQNVKNRCLAAGLDSTKANGKWKLQEIPNQIQVTRQQSGVSGHIHWNMTALMRNGPLAGKLEGETYEKPALTPASASLGNGRPPKPSLSFDAGTTKAKTTRPAPSAKEPGLRVRWEGNEKAWLWLLQTRTRSEWRTEVLPDSQRSHVWPGSQPEVIAVTAIDRYGNAGPASVFQLSRR